MLVALSIPWLWPTASTTSPLVISTPENPKMNNAKFDALIHAQNRLQVCAMLAASAEIEFKVLREKLEVSDSVLSKHLKSLEEANYVVLAKRTDMGRQRTWLYLSAIGRAAYNSHVKALQEIVGKVIRGS